MSSKGKLEGDGQTLQGGGVGIAFARSQIEQEVGDSDEQVLAGKEGTSDRQCCQSKLAAPLEKGHWFEAAPTCTTVRKGEISLVPVLRKERGVQAGSPQPSQPSHYPVGPTGGHTGPGQGSLTTVHKVSPMPGSGTRCRRGEENKSYSC